MEHWAYRRCDVVVANCERLRHELIREGLPARRTLTIHNGVDPCRVVPPPREVIDAFRAELRSLGVQFEIRESDWWNYRDADAILAIRTAGTSTVL